MMLQNRINLKENGLLKPGLAAPMCSHEKQRPKQKVSFWIYQVGYELKDVNFKHQ